MWREHGRAGLRHLGAEAGQAPLEGGPDPGLDLRPVRGVPRAARPFGVGDARELDPLGPAQPERVRPPEEVELPAELGRGRGGRRDAGEEGVDERALVARPARGAPRGRRGGLPLGGHRRPVGGIGAEECRHRRLEARLAAPELGLDLGRGRLEDEAAAVGQRVAQAVERVARLADDARERIEGVLRDEALPPERVVGGDARGIETEVRRAERGAPGPDGDVELEQEAGGQQDRT